ncbi:hypothetical protein NIIDMKKI_16220 [Mycobacterium kansasii]|uniref:Carrier domain-containing protein n=1 Tax=Mycobacterium kansasii TaxID=1768 RepID=A0A7G1I613_MYCKA|nr:hypothetical protein NIIDMKKI_16220 [Mycobacterium kansasii]
MTACAATANGSAPTEAELRTMLGERLPRYMVPQRIVVVDEIPLTANGKLDEAALPDVDAGTVGSAPETATESTLAELLSEMLQIPEVDVTADFLELGLDSIVALSVVQAARRRGIPLRARLILECNNIRELAAAIDAETTGAARDAEHSTEPIPLLPNAIWVYEYGEPRRMGQVEAIRVPEGITAEQLRAALTAIVDGHEVLRSRLDRTSMVLVPTPVGDFFDEAAVSGDLPAAVTAHAEKALESLDPERGSLLSARWLRPPSGPGCCYWPHMCWRWTRHRGGWCSVNSTPPCMYWPADTHRRLFPSTPATGGGPKRSCGVPKPLTPCRFGFPSSRVRTRIWAPDGYRPTVIGPLAC